MKRGAIYWAVGHQSTYVQMAKQSAKSLKKHMPDLHTTLFTDASEPRGHHFDQAVRLPERVLRRFRANQMKAMTNSPYDTTLILDADTWVCGDLSELFEAVEDDRLDLLAPPVQQYRYVHKLDWIFEEAGVPRGFPRLASGVMVFAKNKRVDTLLSRWDAHYQVLSLKGEWRVTPNQPSLRVALHQSPLVRFSILDPSYDYLLYGYFNRPVKVIHWKGNEEQLRAWEREVNKHPKTPRYMRAGKCIETVAQ